MRINEVLAVASTPQARIHDHAAELDLTLWYELSERAIAGEADAAAPGDLLVFALGSLDDVRDRNESRDQVMAQVESAVALVSWPLHEIPVGPILDSLLRPGWQVAAVTPIEHPAVSAAIVLNKAHPILIPGRYLDASGATEATDASLRRVIAEFQLSGLVGRAQRTSDAQGSAAEAAAAAKEHARLEGLLAEVTAQRDKARSDLSLRDRELAASRKSLTTVKQSTPMRVGEAVIGVKRRPVRGLFGLPRALKQARQPAAKPNDAAQ